MTHTKVFNLDKFVVKGKILYGDFEPIATIKIWRTLVLIRYKSFAQN